MDSGLAPSARPGMTSTDRSPQKWPHSCSPSPALRSAARCLGPLGVIGGRIVGAIAGSVIDRTLFSGKRQIEGPRLSDLDVMASTEGAPVPRVYGRARIAGELIWATRLEEVVATRDESAGGKGGGPSVTTTTYSYFANFAHRPLRRADRARRPHLGRRQAARQARLRIPLLRRRRRPASRSA